MPNKKITVHDASALPHSRKSRDEGAWWTCAGKADTWWTHAYTANTRGAHRADKVWRRSQSGRVADTKSDRWRTDGRQGLEAGPKQTQGKQGGHMTWPMQGGNMRTKCGNGHKADNGTRFGGAAKAQSRRRHGGQVPGQPFLRENPTANCLAKNESET